MINKHSRLRMRRRIRSRKRQVVDIGDSANKQLDRHVFRRWHNLYDARRFMVMWILLLSILIMGTVMQTRALGRYYLEPSPVAGGVYTEGIVGSFSNANPIYAVNAVDSSVSRLVFAGLLTYNDQNQLVGDLAASWTSDAKANVYTVRLKPGLTWHDGKPLTADDVVFTFDTIKNPDAKSPLQVSWANIKVEKVSNTAVRFTLPNSYSPFLHSLTTGIVPQHILKDIPAAQLRSALFNNKQPVGAGPFMWKGIATTTDANADVEKQRIQLVRFDDFRGTPAQLDGVTITTFPDALTLREAFDDKKIIGASGLGFEETKVKDTSQIQSTFPQTASTMVFLKNSNPILADVNVRRALVSGTNTANMVNALGYPAVSVKSPILKNQIGYNPAIVQRPYDKQESIKLLEAAGWVVPAGKTIREKNGVPLSFGLVSESNPEYVRLTSLLQKQYEEIGVGLNVSLQSAETIAQSFILAHNYDILLYGINIGADPDTYPYWHSSQADVKSQGRLNLSEYKSGVADTGLEAGRARVAPELRAAKYKPFLEAWRNDAPAVGLYQPNSFVLTNQKVFGADPKTINTPADRFNDIYTWMISTERTIKQ